MCFLCFSDFCKETTTTNDGTYIWPETKAGTNVTIPCQVNVATRYWFVSIVLFSLRF